MTGPGKPKLPLILGLNAAYHETAAAIVRGSEVVFAAEEERYTREKHGKFARVTNPDQLPSRTFAIACKQPIVSSCLTFMP